MATKNPKVIISNDAIQAYYASFFSVEVSNNDVSLSLGQKIPSSDTSTEYVVGRRIALTLEGAMVLKNLLTDALSKTENKNISIKTKK